MLLSIGRLQGEGNSISLALVAIVSGQPGDKAKLGVGFVGSGLDMRGSSTDPVICASTGQIVSPTVAEPAPESATSQDRDPDRRAGGLAATSCSSQARMPVSATASAIADVELAGLLRPAYVVPETKDLAALLPEFRRTSQHMAIVAGFEHVRGSRVVTLDADLQNPPHEIPRLLEEIDKGHDYVGTIRSGRQDSLWRVLPSRMLNRIRERTTRIRITDQGCMLRAYGRNVVDAVNACPESALAVPKSITLGTGLSS